MSQDASETHAFRFGEFELAPLKSELRKCGVRVRLQHQPYDVLALLVKRHGQIVTRDEIRHHLWRDDTFVDFDKGINFCLRQIRAALGDDAREPRYIETIRSHGYRFLMSTYPERRQQARGESLGESAIAFVFPREQSIKLAVLLFDNIGGRSDQDFLATGLRNNLLTHLTQVRGLSVSSIMSMTLGGLSGRSIRETARELDVDVVLGGTVGYSAGRVQISVQLIDCERDRSLLAESYTRNGRDVFEIENQISSVIATQIESRLFSSRTDDSAGTHAYRLYVAGRYFWTKRTEEALRKAFSYFEQAISCQPNYALAYSALADCYLTSSLSGLVPPKEAYPKAKMAVEKALKLDYELAEVHASL